MRVLRAAFLLFMVAQTALPLRAGARSSDGTVIKEYLDRMASFGFAGAVFVDRAGRAVVDGGFGSYACEGNGTKRVERGDPFYVASISKGFTAAAIMALEDEKRLLITDSIAVSLGDVPADKTSITIEHLLTHRSGLGRLTNEQQAGGLSRDQFVRAILAAPLRGEPGRETMYSNEGYALLAVIVEMVSGTSFESYVRRTLIEPAGLESTGWVSEAGMGVGARTAACNGDSAMGGPRASQSADANWSEKGGVGVISTAADLGRWGRALLDGRILSDEARASMFRKREEGFGLGWAIHDRKDGQTMIWHDGLLLPEGWNAQLRIYPEEDVVVAVVSSSYDESPLGWRVAREIDRLLFGGEIDLPPGTSPVGSHEEGILRFKSPSDSQVTLDLGQSSAFVEWEGQEFTNVALAVSDDMKRRLELANTLTERAVSALLEGGSESVLETIPRRDASALTERFEGARRLLEGRFGKLQRARVLHSVPSPEDAGIIETYVDLALERGRSSMRFLWRDGTLWTVSDRGAFIGKTAAVPVQPGRIYLQARGRDRFVGYEPHRKQTIVIQLSRDESGRVRELELRNGPARAVAVSSSTTD